MKFQIDQKDILLGIQRVIGVVERRNTLPILSHIVITASPPSPDGEESGISLFATDLEIGIHDAYPASVIVPGRITFPAKKLLDIVRMLPEGDVEITEQENHWVSIKSGNALFKVAGLPPEQFPVFSSPQEGEPDEVKAVMNAGIFSNLIRKTILSAGENDARYILNAILVQIRRVTGEKEKIRMVATDGHRMSIAEDAIEMDREKPEEENLIVPRKGMFEIKKLVDDAISRKKEDSDVKLAMTLQKGMLTVRHGKVILMVRLLQGNYPKYQQVIPQECEKRIAVPRAALLGALTRVSVISSDERVKIVEMRIQTGQILLYSKTHELGEASESVPTSFCGEVLTLRFMTQHLLDLLPVLDDDEVVFEFKDEASACVIHEKSGRGIFVLAPFKD